MKELFIETIQLIRKKEFGWIPSSLAFYLLVSIIPLILTISLIVIHYLSFNINDIANYFDNNAFLATFSDFIIYVKSNFSNLSLITLIALLIYSIWLSSKGVHGLSKAVDMLYDFESSSLVKGRILSFVTTIVIVIAIFIMFLFASIIPLVLNIFHIKFPIFDSYLFLPIILYITIHLIYLMVSGFKLKNKEVYKGAIFTTLAIYLLLMFANIIFYSARVNLLFGSLAIVILLTHMFFYISYCIYFGLLINVASLKLSKEKNK